MEQIDRFAVIKDEEYFIRINDRSKDNTVLTIFCGKKAVSIELAEILLPIIDEFITSKEEEHEL